MLYVVAGTSKFKGTVSYRFTNRDLDGRIACLEKEGHTEVKLVALPHPMTKEQAIEFLGAQNFVAQDGKPKIGAVPVRAIKPAKAVVNTLVPAVKSKKMLHEALGRELHKQGTLKFLTWDQLTVDCQQEYCLRAAQAAGIEVAAGTYPQLEAMRRR